MPLEPLDNLVKINKLKAEPADQKEFEGMLKSAQRRLQDSQVTHLSQDSQFSLAYGAARALALELQYRHTLESLGKHKAVCWAPFSARRKTRSRIQLVEP